MNRILLATTVVLAALVLAISDGTSNTIQFGAAAAKPAQALNTHLMEEEGLHFPGG